MKNTRIKSIFSLKSTSWLALVAIVFAHLTATTFGQGVPAPVGATNLTDGSLGASGPLPIDLYDSTNLPTDGRGLPLLSSLPGAAVHIYFSFDGQESRNYVPFDTDGDPTTISAAERSDIYELWLNVATFFSFLDVNVTTVTPDIANEPENWVLFTNSVGAGFSIVTLDTGQPSAWVAENLNDSVTSHELAHNFGLRHQGTFDKFGARILRYSEGDKDLEVPLMGSTRADRTYRFAHGHALNAIDIQDDLAVIQASITQFITDGRDGFRADDHAPTAAGATALTIEGNIHTGSGIIERRTDVDAFTFTANSDYAFAQALPQLASCVHLELEIYGPNGELISTDDRFEHFAETAFPTIAGQQYTVKVSSHGDYSELGAYDIKAGGMKAGLRVTQFTSDYVYHSSTKIRLRGFGSYNATTDKVTLSSDSFLGYIYPESDDCTYAYRTLYGDGSITVDVTNMDGPSASSHAGVMIRESNAPGSKMISVALNSSSRPISYKRTADNADYSRRSLSASLGTKLRLTRTGNLLEAEHSTDGITWTMVESVTIDMKEEINIGIFYNASHSQQNATVYTADFSQIEIEDGSTGTAGFETPSGLQATASTSDSVSLQWGAVVGATNYKLSYSADNIVWHTAGSVAANELQFDVNGLSPDRTYFFRVAAIFAGGESIPSSAIHMSTRPGAISDLSVTSVGDTDVVVDWSEENGEIGYEIQRSTESSPWQTLGTVGAQATSFHDSTADAGVLYYYRVITLDDLGSSATSYIVARPLRQQKISLQTNAGGITEVVAENLKNGAEYQLYRSYNLIDWSPVGDAKLIGEDLNATFMETVPQTNPKVFYRLKLIP